MSGRSWQETMPSMKDDREGLRTNGKFIKAYRVQYQVTIKEIWFGAKCCHACMIAY